MMSLCCMESLRYILNRLSFNLIIDYNNPSIKQTYCIKISAKKGPVVRMQLVLCKYTINIVVSSTVIFNLRLTRRYNDQRYLFATILCEGDVFWEFAQNRKALVSCVMYISKSYITKTIQSNFQIVRFFFFFIVFGHFWQILLVLVFTLVSAHKVCDTESFRCW